MLPLRLRLLRRHFRYGHYAYFACHFMPFISLPLALPPFSLYITLMMIMLLILLCCHAHDILRCRHCHYCFRCAMPDLRQRFFAISFMLPPYVIAVTFQYVEDSAIDTLSETQCRCHVIRRSLRRFRYFFFFATLFSLPPLFRRFSLSPATIWPASF